MHRIIVEDESDETSDEASVEDESDETSDEASVEDESDETNDEASVGDCEEIRPIKYDCYFYNGYYKNVYDPNRRNDIPDHAYFFKPPINYWFCEEVYYWICCNMDYWNNYGNEIFIAKHRAIKDLSIMIKNYKQPCYKQDKVLRKKYVNYHIQYYILNYLELELDIYEERIDCYFVNDVLDCINILRKFIKRVYFKVFIQKRLTEFKRKIAIKNILRSKTYNYGLGLKLSMRDCGLELTNS